MSPENSNVPYGRIMILDDHELFGQALRVMLQQMFPDAEINYFNLPETAKKELHLRDYQFLLIDLLIPETNVYDFISFCTATYSKLNIIVVSSTTDHNAVKRCIELGANGYLSKSTSANELRMALEKNKPGKALYQFRPWRGISHRSFSKIRRGPDSKGNGSIKTDRKGA